MMEDLLRAVPVNARDLPGDPVQHPQNPWYQGWKHTAASGKVIWTPHRRSVEHAQILLVRSETFVTESRRLHFWPQKPHGTQDGPGDRFPALPLDRQLQPPGPCAEKKPEPKGPDHGPAFPFMDLPDTARRRVLEMLLIQREHVASAKRCTGVVHVVELSFERFEPQWQRTFYLYRQGLTELQVLPKPERPQADTYGSSGSGCGAQIFRVCKVLYREAAPIFYGRNLFQFESARALLPFLMDRTHLSRHFLEAISLPWPHKGTISMDDLVRRVEGARLHDRELAERLTMQLYHSPVRTFGRVFDWCGTPRYVFEFACDPLWPWLCEHYFNKAAKELPGLKIVDLRAQAYRHNPAALAKQSRWDLARGYRVARFRQLAMLNFLDDLSMVRISNAVFVRPLHRAVPGRWQVAPSQEVAGVPLRAIDEYRAEAFNEPEGHPGHVAVADQAAFERNYAHVYRLPLAQQQTLARRERMHLEFEYRRRFRRKAWQRSPEQPVAPRARAERQDWLHAVIDDASADARRAADADADANEWAGAGDGANPSPAELLEARGPQTLLRVPERDFFMQPLSDEQKDMVRQSVLPPDSPMPPANG